MTAPAGDCVDSVMTARGYPSCPPPHAPVSHGRRGRTRSRSSPDAHARGPRAGDGLDRGIRSRNRRAGRRGGLVRAVRPREDRDRRSRRGSGRQPGATATHGSPPPDAGMRSAASAPSALSRVAGPAEGTTNARQYAVVTSDGAVAVRAGSGRPGVSRRRHGGRRWRWWGTTSRPLTRSIAPRRRSCRPNGSLRGPADRGSRGVEHGRRRPALRCADGDGRRSSSSRRPTGRPSCRSADSTASREPTGRRPADGRPDRGGRRARGPLARCRHVEAADRRGKPNLYLS